MTRPIIALLAVCAVLTALPDRLPAQSSSAIYSQACAAEIEAIPSFECADGVTVPITIDGVEVTDRAPATCDRPGLLDNGHGSDGQCVPFSRILNLSTEAAQVSVMCRQKKFRSHDATEYDEIDVIAHNPDTGATCWFQAKADDGGTVSGVAVPAPTSATDTSFWVSPEAVVADDCGSCHDNDPFMYSPFVSQVWDHVPTNPFGPYTHVGQDLGFDAWPRWEMAPRDNTCLSCHRIGTGQWAVDGAPPDDQNHEKPGTCGQLASWMTGAPFPGADELARSYPLSHAMPPNIGMTEQEWAVRYGDSVAQVHSCCADPSQAWCNVREIRSYVEDQSSP